VRRVVSRFGVDLHGSSGGGDRYGEGIYMGRVTGQEICMRGVALGGWGEVSVKSFLFPTFSVITTTLLFSFRLQSRAEYPPADERKSPSRQ